MRVQRSAARTDAGRKRRHNEDAFVCEPPLFAVADGMGGAQAGELASRLAAASVGRSRSSGVTGRERVVSLIKEANRSVYERAAEDISVSGMGTTMTVALVDEECVWIGHVGDSRAYLVRHGDLKQVTDDHSLVAELVRSGRLTPDEADAHPHRSVITRALGTEPEVDVDALAVVVEPDDLFILCSDGLTTMVDNVQILDLVERHRADLDATARALVDAANVAGGEDNITVVLFSVGQAEDETTQEVVVEAGDDEDTLHGIPSPFADTEVVEQRASSPRRLPVGATVAVIGAMVVLLGALAVFGLSRSHFVGVEKNGHVAVYQGVPWNLGFSVHLYRVVYESPLLAANLSQSERRRLFDHDLLSRSAARRRVDAYAQDVVP
jgi:serine/threonine protein phosphatase PrpC